VTVSTTVKPRQPRPVSTVSGRSAPEDAADVLYVLIGPDLYRTLLLERSWTKKEWAAWIERSILAELFNLAA
jgi:hypothetical protein